MLKYLPLAILIIAVVACGGAAATAPAQPIQVIYKIDSTMKYIPLRLTYANETGATVQEKAMSPWEKKFTAKPGQFVYLSAQLDDGKADDVSCNIAVNGATLQEAKSTGQYTIATCSGSVK
jgi:hypothetical protein